MQRAAELLAGALVIRVVKRVTRRGNRESFKTVGSIPISE
jgi:hypothetical protein